MSNVDTSLAKAIFDFLSEDDWDYGLELHHSGKVSNFNNLGGLLTGNVVGSAGREEVRIKIHPAGHQIQWLECTCRKSRLKGQHCEHMAAVLLHMDESFADEFSSLSVKPSAKKKQRDRDPQQSVSGKIVEQHNDKIESVKGGVKTGQLEVSFNEAHIHDCQLSIDESAELLGNVKKKFIKDETKKLKVFPIAVAPKWYFGFFIKEIDENTLELKKAFFVKRTKKEIENVVGMDVISSEFESLKNTQKEKGNYEIIAFSDLIPFIGDKYTFLPNRGYYECKKPDIHFMEAADGQKINADAYANLVKDNFSSFTKIAPVFYDSSVAIEIVKPELSKINVIKENNGWFFLDPMYASGKKQTSMLELLKHHRKSNKNFQKVDGVWFEIPDVIKQFDWVVDDDQLKADSLGLFRLQATLGEFDTYAGKKAVLNKLRQKTQFNPETKPPSLANSKLDLRPYQAEGYNWLYWLFNNNLHGLLADDMGLGKTHQAMAIMTGTQTKDSKFLVVCPTSVLDHWADKIEDFCPNLRCSLHHGPQRYLDIENTDVVVTSYGVLLRDISQLRKIDWQISILDEAHLIKNSKTASYSAACTLESKMRICLTGTPLENDIFELKNLFDYLLPGYLGSDKYFKKVFLEDKKEQLPKLIHPFKLRRTKTEVIEDLPAKIEDKRYCGLSDDQVSMYKDIIEQKAGQLIATLKSSDETVPYLHVFATLSYLKQICDHPALMDPSRPYTELTSGKFELLKELVFEAIGSNHKIVIYSQYIRMINIISDFLGQSDINHVVLTGQTQKRGKVIKQFQEDPNTKVFVGSLLAGGVGIDLTSASVVIHYDRWWNASKENQATDRVHRIGQEKQVFVYKLITRGTLEEKIDSMIARKQELFDTYLERDEEFFKTLSRSELIDLLT